MRQLRAQALACRQPCKEALSCLLECHLRGGSGSGASLATGQGCPVHRGRDWAGGAALAAGGCCHVLCAAAARPAAVPHFIGLVNQFALSAQRM